MKNKGFTLVELLIVMAIIGILIAIAIVGLGAAQADARNSARETAVKGIAGLLETYYGANGQSYPNSISVPSSGSVTFNPVNSTQLPYPTSSNLCKPTIVPSGMTYSSTGCSGSSSFCNPYSTSSSSCGQPTTNSDTLYLYTPYQNTTPYASVPSGSVTGYLVGACLENGTIFVYTSNGSNAPYTQTGPNSIKFSSGITYTCS
ncbi:type II secretion system GspH family protein [Patescibacteria group bacterium]|nr:type II secretion system GspH family protein [Patescibacteria group bacterium]